MDSNSKRMFSQSDSMRSSGGTYIERKTKIETASEKIDKLFP
jgi:hypothetical protein